jgi:hypothetical protein
MSLRTTGEFTLGLRSLELQLKTLLENAGGTKAGRFLDVLCKLSKDEQELVLAVFTKVIGDVLAGDRRLGELQYDELKAFEEQLYNDVLAEIEKSNTENRTVKPVARLQVLSGGRTTEKQESSANLKPVISITSLQRDRSKNDKDVLH